MFQASMRWASTSATAQATAYSRIFRANSPRRSAGIFLESSKPTMRRLGLRITAAATTGPNSAPRPASSRPAMRVQPSLRAARSKREEQSRAINCVRAPECYHGSCLSRILTNVRPSAPRAVRHNRNLHAGWIFCRPVNLLRGCLIIRFLRFKNIRHELLRIAVVQRKPRALNLHHTAMALLEHVIGRVQIDGVRSNLTGHDGLWLFVGFPV